MARRSTRESLSQDIDTAKKVAKQMQTDLALLKVGCAGLAALCIDLARELQEYADPEPVPDPKPDTPSDTTDGN